MSDQLLSPAIFGAQILFATFLTGIITYWISKDKEYHPIQLAIPVGLNLIAVVFALASIMEAAQIEMISANTAGTAGLAVLSIFPIQLTCAVITTIFVNRVVRNWLLHLSK